MKVPSITREAIDKVTEGDAEKEIEIFAAQQPELIAEVAQSTIMTEAQKVAFKAGLHFMQRCLEETTLQ